MKNLKEEFSRNKFIVYRSGNDYDGYSIAHCLICYKHDGDELYFTDEPEFFKGKNPNEIEEVNDCFGGVLLGTERNVIEAFDMQEVEPVVSVYERHRQYGGAEEGGWWYDTDQFIDEISILQYRDFDNVSSKEYSGDVWVSLDFYAGARENTNTQHYC